MCPFDGVIMICIEFELRWKKTFVELAHGRFEPHPSAFRQAYDWSSASDATLKNMDANHMHPLWAMI